MMAAQAKKIPKAPKQYVMALSLAPLTKTYVLLIMLLTAQAREKQLGI